MSKFVATFLAIGSGAVLSVSLAYGEAGGGSRIDLAEGWTIQSSAKVAEKGEVVSTSGFRTGGWYKSSVPTTVVGALVRNKVYPDPYFGMNLRSIPGTTYNIGANFSNMAMPADSPFAVPWWYRTQFRLPAALTGKRLWLNFDAINYRANIWLNGTQLANSERGRRHVPHVRVRYHRRSPGRAPRTRWRWR